MTTAGVGGGEGREEEEGEEEEEEEGEVEADSEDEGGWMAETSTSRGETESVGTTPVHVCAHPTPSCDLGASSSTADRCGC